MVHTISLLPSRLQSMCMHPSSLLVMQTRTPTPPSGMMSFMDDPIYIMIFSQMASHNPTQYILIFPQMACHNLAPPPPPAGYTWPQFNEQLACTYRVRGSTARPSRSMTTNSTWLFGTVTQGHLLCRQY